VGSNSAVPRDNPRDSRYKFSLPPPFLKPWSKRDPGKDGVRKPSCFSDLPTFLPFVQHPLFRDWKEISSNRLSILHHVAQSSLSLSALSFLAILTCAGTQMKLTLGPLHVSC
jgi:hypothetical protein